MRHPTPINTPPQPPDHEADFVLFPSQTSTDSHQARRTSELAQAISRTHPNPTYLASPSSNNYQQYLHPERRLSSQQPANFPSAASVSPPQNRRVSDLIQGTGFTTPANSQRSTSTGNIMHHSRHHANSAPSSMINLPGQRPTVAHFPHSDVSSFHQSSEMPRPDVMQGSASRGHSSPSSVLTSCASDSNYWDDSAMYSYNAHSQSNGNFLDGSSSSLASYSSTDHGVSPATLTVTPNDLFLTPSTFQHTPDSDIFDSPAPLYSNNVSPNFAIQDSPADYGSFDFDANAATKNFFPALPGNDDMQAPPPRPATIDDMQSPLVNSAAMKVSTSMSRTASYQSPVKSPRGPRPSLSSGITKAKPKKRQGKLKDMVVNPDDPTSFKRCRNTLAARNSRARRQQRMEDLEEQVSKWKARAINLGWQDADDEEDLE